jgi:hypothetical protein
MQDHVAERERTAGPPGPAVEHERAFAAVPMRMRAEGESDDAGDHAQEGIGQRP